MLEKYKLKRAISNTRKEMAYFGCDLSDMTNEEIEEGVTLLGEAASKAGITVGEFCEAWGMI